MNKIVLTESEKQIFRALYIEALEIYHNNRSVAQLRQLCRKIGSPLKLDFDLNRFPILLHYRRLYQTTWRNNFLPWEIVELVRDGLPEMVTSTEAEELLIRSG